MSSKASLWNSVGIHELYHSCSMKDFRGDEQAKKAVEDYIANLQVARKTGVGLYLFGENGLGKTLALCEILKAGLETENHELVHRGVRHTSYRVQKVSFSEIIDKFTQAWYDNEAKALFREKIMNVDFLGIDDATKAYIPTNNSLHISALDYVFRHRVERMRPIILTGNEKPAALGEIFGKSIASLLSGHLMGVEFKGTDYRRDNKAKEKWNLLVKG